eukprot:TRINITY_DN13867_c0_g1_i1.p1 TRINITY_DN13867_c0_g1~~TRINITY_DN13867_c0_g1_i1.p1  ORF type:complete len:473 (+),score=81.38 TRINITY_DN13867_c0_g1_i1:179-1597(+)
MAARSQGEIWGPAAPLSEDPHVGGLRRDMRDEVRRAKQLVQRTSDAAVHQLTDALEDSRNDAEMWRQQTDDCLEWLGAAEIQITELKRRQKELDEERENWRRLESEAAVSRAAQQAAALAAVRSESQAAETQGRSRSQKLQQALSDKQGALEQRSAETALVAAGAAEVIGRSIRRASAAFRPRGDLSEGQEGIVAALDWLDAMEVALRFVADGSPRCSEEASPRRWRLHEARRKGIVTREAEAASELEQAAGRGAVSISTRPAAPEARAGCTSVAPEAYEEPTWVSGRRERLDEAAARANAEDDRTMEVCEAVRGAATLVALHWSDVVLKAGESESLADDERGLIEELHVVRERCSTYEEELGRVTEQIEHLKEDIDHENQCTKRALDEQRWLVPRVAAAVDGMSDGDAAPSRHRSSTCAFPHSRGVKADWSPTWEEQVYNYSASGLSVPPTKMTALSPVSWAGYHCDRRRY